MEYEPGRGKRVDPVIELYKQGIDRTLIRDNLRLTIDERLDRLIAMHEAYAELSEVRNKRPGVKTQSPANEKP